MTNERASTDTRTVGTSRIVGVRVPLDLVNELERFTEARTKGQGIKWTFSSAVVFLLRKALATASEWTQPEMFTSIKEARAAMLRSGHDATAPVTVSALRAAMTRTGHPEAEPIHVNRKLKGAKPPPGWTRAVKRARRKRGSRSSSKSRRS